MRNPITYYAPLLLGLYGRIAPRQAARLLADLISRPGGQNPTQPWELAHGTDGKAIEGGGMSAWGASEQKRKREVDSAAHTACFFAPLAHVSTMMRAWSFCR